MLNNSEHSAIAAVVNAKGSLSGMTREQLEAMVLSFQKNSQRKLTLKVSKKGAISLYGLGRFPVTLYPKAWEQVLGMAEDIKAFAEANASLLSTGKDDPRFANVSDDATD